MPRRNTASSAPRGMRFSLLPGEYHLDIPVGFYTQIVRAGGDAGCGARDGQMYTRMRACRATTRRVLSGAEWRGFQSRLTDAAPMQSGGVAVAVFFRRMHVLGDLVLHQKRVDGRAAGGFRDSVIDGNVVTGIAATVALAQYRVEELDGFELEHGICRREQSAGGRVAAIRN